MRTVIMAFCTLFVLCLAGCGSDEGVPSTQVEVLHIQAMLPGTDWHKASTEKKGEFETERWENGDGTLFFRVADAPDDALSYPLIQASSVAQYMAVMDFPPSTLVEDSTMLGRSALRMEGVSPESDAYHTVDFVFIAGLRHFFVGAGAANSVWDAGGSDTVYAIIQSAKLAIVK